MPPPARAMLLALGVVLGSAAGLLPAATPSPPPQPFRFANMYGSDMVLQSSPARAVVWGVTPHAFDAVTVAFGGAEIAATTTLYNGNWTWRAVLPPTPASLEEAHTVVATSGGTGAVARLDRVLFGDVWVCSGQSNMAYGIGGVNDSQAEAAAMARYDSGIRLYQVGAHASHMPEIEATSPSPWSPPCPYDPASNTTKCRVGFSAVCWFYGRDIFEALEPRRPIGLIESNVGGTPDEHWSSPDALAACSNPAHPMHDSVLWNGMIVPLLNTTIRGAVWYQGENDHSHPGGLYDGYNCTFPAMIDDWRAKWHQHTDGATDPTFPFGFVQLNNNGPATAAAFSGAAVDDPAGGVFSNKWGFAGLRWAQTAGYGFAPNPRMPRTFMAVVLDTPNPNGGVHSPFKQPVGSRLARAGLAEAYGAQQDTLGPRVARVNWTAASAAAPSLRIDFAGLSTASGVGGIEVRNATGFEVLEPRPDTAAGAQPGLWRNAPIVAHTASSVTLSPAPANGTKLRYLWYGNPCGPGCFGCAVYGAAAPIGNLTGELDFLPLAPFIMDLPAGPR